MKVTSMLHRTCVLGILLAIAGGRPLPGQAVQASKSTSVAALSHEDSAFVIREQAMWSALRRRTPRSLTRPAGGRRHHPPCTS